MKNFPTKLAVIPKEINTIENPNEKKTAFSMINFLLSPSFNVPPEI